MQTPIFFIMYLLVNDKSLGILIEQVNSRHIESDLDLVACSCSASGGYARDHVLLLKADVQINLGAHKLGYLDLGLDNAVGIDSTNCASSWMHSGRIPAITSLPT